MLGQMKRHCFFFCMLLENSTYGHVFGLHLGKVISNDIQCERRRLLLLKERQNSADAGLDRPRFVAFNILPIL